MLRQDVDELLAEEKLAYDAMVRACAAAPPSDSIELDMRIKIIDGDTVIADTAQDGGFLGTCAKFEAYVRARFPAAV